MMDVNGLISAASQFFNENKYAEAIEKLHQAWDGITDKSTQIREQIRIQDLLGGCYLEQARKTKDADKADKLFGQAVKHHQKQLQLAEQLKGKEDKIWQQIYAQYWLVRCYIERVKRSKNTNNFRELACQYFFEYRGTVITIK